MPSIVFANRKGGVGKTVSALYTGRWLSRAGRDVRLLDLDPQQGLWDIAALLGAPEGVFSKRLRLITGDAIPTADAHTYILVDTPPALDGSLPALNQADYLIVPVIPEAQELAQLVKFLTMLDRTKRERPFTRTLGILPVRCIERWTEHRTLLAQARAVATDFDVPLLPPVPFSRAVSRYSLAGGLWRHVAELLIATCEAGTARAAA